MSGKFGRLLLSLSGAGSDAVAEVLARCPRIEIEAGAPYFRNAFPAGSLLAVDEGFVVVRMSSLNRSRSIITCEAGPGRLVLPPSQEEMLFGLGTARLTVIPPEALARLVSVPEATRMLLEQLVATLAEKQEAIGIFANTRHIDRVRRKLEGAVTHAGGEAEHASLVRGRHDGDMPAQPLVVLVADVGERDEEVLTRPEVHLFTQKVEGHEERSLRDVLLFLDPGFHTPILSQLTLLAVRLVGAPSSSLLTPRGCGA